MSRKGRRKLLFGFQSLAICGAAVFMIKGVRSFYADKQEDTRRAQVIEQSYTQKPGAAVTETQGRVTAQEAGETEYQGIIGSMDWDFEDGYLLAKIAMAEAESEGVEGKALVMLVVLNRVWSDDFPDTIEEVIFQEGQFSPISNGRYESVEPDAECYEALELIQVDKWDESQGALYFESESESDWHKKHLDFLFQYGNHYFYR